VVWPAEGAAVVAAVVLIGVTGWVATMAVAGLHRLAQAPVRAVAGGGVPTKR
jgi:hypothetical protein